MISEKYIFDLLLIAFLLFYVGYMKDNTTDAVQSTHSKKEIGLINVSLGSPFSSHIQIGDKTYRQDIKTVNELHDYLDCLQQTNTLEVWVDEVKVTKNDWSEFQ